MGKITVDYYNNYRACSDNAKFSVLGKVVVHIITTRL